MMEFVTNNNGIRFLLEWRDREKATNGKVPPAGLTQIRSEYEKIYGSIYLTP